jgi:hypothetical protein
VRTDHRGNRRVASASHLFVRQITGHDRAMRRFFILLAACSRPQPVAPVPAPRSQACQTAEHRQLDFWLGDWDVAIHTRQSPTGPMGEAKGRQHVEAVLGGCAVAETFSAAGPGPAWAGRSYSSWQPVAGKWRQTWVDDQGSYLAFTGGIENGAMTLYGEPREGNGTPFQMRMVFLDVTPTSIRWEWQRSEDRWKSVTVMMRIDYTRAGAPTTQAAAAASGGG